MVTNLIKKVCISSMLLICAVILISCQKDLCYDHRHDKAKFLVRFDWKDYPKANPATMALAAFVDGSQPVLIGFKGREGGEAALMPNTYRLIGFNDDTEALFSRGDTWGDYEIFAQQTVLSRFTRMFSNTRSVVPKARGTEEEPVVFEPDELWSSVVGETVVSGDSVEIITMPMESGIKKYSFIITNVDNLAYVVEVTATLSGMSESWMPAQHRCSDTYSIIPFPLTGDGESVLRGTVRTFGHCPGKGVDHAKHFLTVYVEMTDGSKLYYTIDVTEKMHDADHINPWDGGTGNTEIPIIIDNLPLPQPIYNGNGMHPSVSEWQEKQITINLMDL